MIVETYTINKGCDIWGFERLQRTDKLNKQSSACDDHLYFIEPLLWKFEFRRSLKVAEISGLACDFKRSELAE